MLCGLRLIQRFGDFPFDSFWFALCSARHLCEPFACAWDVLHAVMCWEPFPVLPPAVTWLNVTRFELARRRPVEHIGRNPHLHLRAAVKSRSACEHSSPCTPARCEQRSFCSSAFRRGACKWTTRHSSCMGSFDDWLLRLLWASSTIPRWCSRRAFGTDRAKAASEQVRKWLRTLF